ncbi:PREDICTED: uncharacterized protein LOC109148508 [Ipomoea nil]|uniref:uncharacterized protein LOC109148508 n=1 Tax=Ipomoea nil TaxID=35883 RepID=UPI000900C11E|nr:PREDICTED: uncharacterized protein LOC109148508 [Ipomoea nil]
MKLPQGFEFEKPNQVCKLRRSLYGLKQASRQWNSKLSAALLQMMFVQSKSDPSLFTKGEGATFIVVLIYVDDILLTSPDISQIQNLKMYLDNAFKIKDLGELGYFLGIEARSSDTGLNLCQCKYAMDILTETGFLECKPASSPMVPGIHLCHGDSEPFANIGSYRRLVGRLLYLTATRPDIAYAIQQLSQFFDSPTVKHMQAAHHVLRYIKRAPGQGIFYPKGEATQLTFSPTLTGHMFRIPSFHNRLLCVSWQCTNFLEMQETIDGI